MMMRKIFENGWLLTTELVRRRWQAVTANGVVVRVRRRFFALLALLGFGLVAAGAAHVNQSREARLAAGERAAAQARQWLRGVAFELPATTADDWRAECGREPLVLLEAICPTEVPR